jgi:hypothetical protein
MAELTDRPRVLRAIKKVLSDVYDYFLDTMEILDNIGRGSVGAGMAPLVGGYAMKDPKEAYREALIRLDTAEKALQPLARRVEDGRVNASHFKDEKALVLINDIMKFDYDLLIKRLSQQQSRASVWHRLDELSKKTKGAFDLVAES